MRNRNFVYALCLALLNLASPHVAQAALVGTLYALEASGTRAQDLAIVNSALTREQVRGQMEALGVDPSAVDARVARLTDSKLRSLADRMDQMPARREPGLLQHHGRRADDARSQGGVLRVVRVHPSHRQLPAQ